MSRQFVGITLKQAADETEKEGYKPSNPITLALGVGQLQESPDTRDRVLASLTERLDSMSAALAEFEGRVDQSLFAIAAGAPEFAYSGRSIARHSIPTFFSRIRGVGIDPEMGNKVMAAQWEALLEEQFGDRWTNLPPEIKSTIRQSIGSMNQTGRGFSPVDQACPLADLDMLPAGGRPFAGRFPARPHRRIALILLWLCQRTSTLE
jgi:hypothetical protein